MNKNERIATKLVETILREAPEAQTFEEAHGYADANMWLLDAYVDAGFKSPEDFVDEDLEEMNDILQLVDCFLIPAKLA